MLASRLPGHGLTFVEVDVKESLFDQLVGVWTLFAADFAAQTGERTYLFGKDPVGLLTYSSSGRMSA
jgi:hypothetical protein